MRTQGEGGHLQAKETVLRGGQPCRRPDLGLPASRSTGREILLFQWRGLWQPSRALQAVVLSVVQRHGLQQGCSGVAAVSALSAPAPFFPLGSGAHRPTCSRGRVTHQPCPACTRSGHWGSNPSFVSGNEVPLESCRPGEQPETISCSTNADIPTGWPQVRHP